MSPGVYAAVFLVMLLASTVQASTGFGQGLIAAPMLRLLHPDLLPVPLLLVSVVVSISVVARNARPSDVGEVAPAFLGRLVGVAIALVMLARLSERGLSITVGVIVLTFATLRAANVRFPWNRKTLSGAGVASGVGGTIAALGGAPIALLYVEHAEARDFRGPMSVYGLAGTTMSLTALYFSGDFDGEALRLGLALLPPIVIGMVASKWTTPIVDRGLLRPLVLVLSAGSAIVLIISELL